MNIMKDRKRDLLLLNATRAQIPYFCFNTMANFLLTCYKIPKMTLLETSAKTSVIYALLLLPD